MPPKDAPNILLIITDDAGFGVPSTFGGVIPTLTKNDALQSTPWWAPSPKRKLNTRREVQRGQT